MVRDLVWVVLTGQLVTTSLQHLHQEKTRERLTDTNTWISCKENLEIGLSLGKGKNKTLSNTQHRWMELTTSVV